ncbi:Lnb N-terminal periplasmic domain-containing protein [Rhizobium sp. RAF56]|jgi:hypothetical protein|uniref:Lnb N-terminal periplasmic domain-containing protein n=1 Tax=Rhizobium sp. RAF56 TaxID=3233062 RepID=UPI003F97EDFB
MLEGSSGEVAGQRANPFVRTARFGARLIVALAVLLATAWASLALSYRLPLSPLARELAAAAFALAGVATAVSILWRPRLVVILSFAVAFAGVLIWWSTIKPPLVADWAGDVARQVTGTLDGDTITLANVRNFAWKADGSYAEQWETRTYDLRQLKSLDLIMSYWAGPEMAHMILSFGFQGDKYLAWSIEVRRRVGGEFSPLADLFKSNPLVIVAADERDVVRVRSNVRGEDVQLFRMNVPPENAARLFLQYVADANDLAEHPRFYNSLFTNCTTTAARMMRAVGATFPLDWRLVANGYLPEFAYDRNALDTRVAFDELKARAHIDANARKADASDTFSQAIRAGVPSPFD